MEKAHHKQRNLEQHSFEGAQEADEIVGKDHPALNNQLNPTDLSMDALARNFPSFEGKDTEAIDKMQTCMYKYLSNTRNWPNVETQL